VQNKTIKMTQILHVGEYNGYKLKKGEDIEIDPSGLTWVMIDLGSPKVCVLGLSPEEFEYYKKQDFDPNPPFKSKDENFDPGFHLNIDWDKMKDDNTYNILKQPQ
jgi:hypothetical protein